MAIFWLEGVDLLKNTLNQVCQQPPLSPMTFVFEYALCKLQHNLVAPHVCATLPQTPCILGCKVTHDPSSNLGGIQWPTHHQHCE